MTDHTGIPTLGPPPPEPLVYELSCLASAIKLVWQSHNQLLSYIIVRLSNILFYSMFFFSNL